MISRALNSVRQSAFREAERHDHTVSQSIVPVEFQRWSDVRAGCRIRNALMQALQPVAEKQVGALECAAAKLLSAGCPLALPNL